MQSPKKTKWRKQMKQVRHIRGVEKRGSSVSFGDYAVQAQEGGWITNRQIEAARIAIARHVKRGAKLWIRVFCDKPLTTKPAEVRMGSGKGAPEKWVAEIRAGRIMFEMSGVAEELAVGALTRAIAKLPIKCKLLKRSENLL